MAKTVFKYSNGNGECGLADFLLACQPMSANGRLGWCKQVYTVSCLSRFNERRVNFNIQLSVEITVICSS